jgi:hypothetical protein
VFPTRLSAEDSENAEPTARNSELAAPTENAEMHAPEDARK